MSLYIFFFISEILGALFNISPFTTVMSTSPVNQVISLYIFILISEVLGALFSVFIIWLVTGILCYMAIERIQMNHYKDVNADEMLVTASVGVVFNIV
jgi:zinc transporter 2